MDLDDVVDLATNAAESVLRFHVVALRSTDRAPFFVDINAFKSAVQNALRKAASKKKQKQEQKQKQYGNGHDGSVDLVRVAGLTGDAAFRAATEWNSVSDPANHVRPEWFRNCVCELVKGAVHNIARLSAIERLEASVHSRQSLYEEYLDPSGDLLMLDSCREIESEHHHHAREEALSYYGFETETPSHPPEEDDEQQSNVRQEEEEILSSHPAHFIKSAWQAINSYAATPFSSNAAAKCQATLASLVVPKKRKAASIENDDNDDKEDEMEEEGVEAETDAMRARKRASVRRALSNKGLSHHNRMPPPPSRKASVDSALLPRSDNARKPKSLWTKQEEITLLSARQEGKSWSAVHELLGHRTASACEKKYRDLNLSSQYQQAQSTLGTAAHEEEKENDEDEEEECQVAAADESGDEEMDSDDDMDDNADGL